MRKIGFHFYTVPEYEEEQTYLTKMHKKGWKFVKYVFPCFYVFEKCEPADVIYQLDYNEEGIKEREAYYQVYRDCGWEHLCNVMGYSYFRKPAEGSDTKDEIFSDEASKLDMVERVYRGRMIPCLILFFGVLCPQLLLQFVADNGFNRVIFVLYLIIFIVYINMFIKFYYKRHKLRERINL